MSDKPAPARVPTLTEVLSVEPSPPCAPGDTPAAPDDSRDALAERWLLHEGLDDRLRQRLMHELEPLMRQLADEFAARARVAIETALREELARLRADVRAGAEGG